MMASTATFTASWRDSNCAVRADNHKNKKTIKMKIMEVGVKSLHGVHLTCHRGIGFSQPCSDDAGLLLGCMKHGLRNPKVDLELAILLSHLGVAVLSHPPLPKEASGIITVVRIRGTDDEAGAEDTASKGLTSLGRGRRMSFTTNLETK